MRHFYGLQDNKIIDRAFALSNVFFTTTGTIVGTGATAGCHEVTYNRDNKITVSNSSTAPCFWKTTETTGTTRRTDATAGCHEVTYNWDNKITVVNSFSLSTVVFFQTTTMTTGITGTTVNVTR